MDPKRLVEIEIEGHEPYRVWRNTDSARSWDEGRAALSRIEKYLPQVFAKVDELKDYAISFFQSVIRTESVNSAPPGEKPVATLVEKELESFSFSTVSIEPEPTRKSVVGNRTFGRKEKPRVIFYGHLDTVPAGNLAEWSSPPFEARLVDGKIIGRGAQDCKMGVASAVVAARVLSEAG